MLTEKEFWQNRYDRARHDFYKAKELCNKAHMQMIRINTDQSDIEMNQIYQDYQSMQPRETH